MRSTDLATFEQAWQARDVIAMKRLAPAVGCMFDLRGLLVLEKRGGRVPLADIVVVAAQACHDPAGIVLREYGESRARDKTVVLAACDRETNKLTIGAAEMRRTATLGAVWPELKPWFKEVARNAAQVRAWAAVTADDRVQFKLVPLEVETGRADVDDLLRQVIAHPDDRAVRTVLADALLERDDPRGELVRLDLELDALAADDPRADELAGRVAALEARHGPTLASSVTDHVSAYKLRGGFVDSITVTAARFAKHGVRLLASQPIREVVIDPIDGAAMTTLARAAAFPQIRSLHLRGDHWRPRPIDFAAFAGVRAECLTALVVQGCRFTGAAFAALDAPALARIELGESLDPEALRSLFAGPARRCTAIALDCRRSGSDDPPDDTGYTTALETTLDRLAELDITGVPFATDRWLAQLVARAPILRDVDVDACGAQTAAALAAVPTLLALTVTELPTDAALETLLASRSLASLSILTTFQREIAPAEIDRIARTLLALPSTHALRHVYLGGTSRKAELDARFAG